MRRAATLLSVILLVVFGSAGPAAAHVTVSASSVQPGAWAILTFTVPTESETASTVGLTVLLPTGTPFRSVLTEAVPGWTVTTGPAKVEWKATGAGIGPGQFGRFAISAGPLPAGGTLFLPTTQHYSDGTDVDWVQQAQDGAEPENPAPSITIAAPPTPAEPDRTGVWLALALLAAAIALLRVRR